MCALPDKIADRSEWQQRAAKAVGNSFTRQKGETKEEHKQRILDTMRNIGT